MPRKGACGAVMVLTMLEVMIARRQVMICAERKVMVCLRKVMRCVPQERIVRPQSGRWSDRFEKSEGESSKNAPRAVQAYGKGGFRR